MRRVGEALTGLDLEVFQASEYGWSAWSRSVWFFAPGGALPGCEEEYGTDSGVEGHCCSGAPPYLFGAYARWGGHLSTDCDQRNYYTRADLTDTGF